jgi:hypothetical protein
MPHDVHYQMRSKQLTILSTFILHYNWVRPRDITKQTELLNKVVVSNPTKYLGQTLKELSRICYKLA